MMQCPPSSPEVGRANSSNDKLPAEPSQTTDSPIGIFDDNVAPSDKPPENTQVSTPKAESASSSTYGPLRRVRQKDGPPALYRPPAMHADDFAEMMREVVPQLVEEATQLIDQSMHPKRRLEIQTPVMNQQVIGLGQDELQRSFLFKISIISVK